MTPLADTAVSSTPSQEAPGDAPAAPAPAIRSAVRGLRLENERRAWASRPWAARPTAALPAHMPADVGADGHASEALGALLAQLRAVTTRYVCGQRDQGARPEQMLARVKALVREAMAAEGWSDPEATRALTAQVVRWSIDAYYDR